MAPGIDEPARDEWTRLPVAEGTRSFTTESVASVLTELIENPTLAMALTAPVRFTDVPQWRCCHWPHTTRVAELCHWPHHRVVANEENALEQNY